MRSQFTKALTLLVAAALVMAGCGGGSSSVSKAEFVKAADAICRKADEAQVKALTAAEGKSEKEQIRAGLRTIQAAAEELAALEVPSGDEDEIAAIVAEMEAAVNKVESGSPSTLQEAFTSVEKRAAKYGFKDCSEPL
jgi:hypothetical protein